VGAVASNAPLTAEPLISLRGVTKTYGQGATMFQALKGVDLDIAAGDFVAVMGPSGSGKSTTMNILGCLDVPSDGTFLFRGHHVETLDRDQRALLRRKYLGFVFQGFNLLSRTSALENVELPLLYRGDEKRARRDAAMASLDTVGLADWWDHTPAELSGGQQQRAAIARAIVGEPRLILADEPTGNLDTENGAQVMDILGQLNAEGATIVMVTHSPSHADIAKRTVHMLDGRILSSARRAA